MKNIRRRRTPKNNRGSALLVSLMVMVGLSLLGLGFVAISETESTIAKNQSQALQTLSVAEAGGKMVVEWFQDPAWGMGQAGMPANASCATYGTSPCSPLNSPGVFMKTVRKSGGVSIGVYKPKASTNLLDKPYRPADADRLFGSETSADLIINRTTVGNTVMDNLNTILLGANPEDKLGGELTEIRVFAPPIVGGTLNADGFWEGGQRYGVASIKVTAQQFQNPVAHTGVVASHSVRMVVGELPLPIPAGPIQGDANVSFGGSFFVHWGMETSRGDLQVSRSLASMPWANAYERPHFEHGYETGTSLARLTITASGSGYTSAPVPIIAPPAGGGTTATATATIAGGAVTGINITNRGSGYNPDPRFAPAVTWTCAACGGTGVAGTASIGAEVYYTTGGQFDDKDYFHEVLDKQFDDPWYGTRAVGDNNTDGATAYNSSPQCYNYQYYADELTTSQPSYAFQWQDANTYPTKKKVVFPTILYDYWKRIAQQGRGFQGMYYFNYTGPAGGGGGMFQLFNRGASRPMSFWANTLTPSGAGLGPGVYFFDTKTGANPQALTTLTNPTRASVLTDAEAWNSQSFNKNFLMQGFVYMNANTFGTQGAGNAFTTISVNFPGEPFRDVGYPIWDTAAASNSGVGTGNWKDCGGVPCRYGAGDGTFSCQDLNLNGKCDIVVMLAPQAWSSYDTGSAGGAATSHVAGAPTYVPKVWKSNADAQADYGAPCTLPAANYDGTNAAATDCSEPHEPYLNLIYPATALVSNKPAQIKVGWEAPGAQTYRPKLLDSAGARIPCAAIPAPDTCTSNSYDVDGSIVDLDVILYGIIYNEGQYDSPGNAAYFGSVLIQDAVAGTGTADVWFDEKLIKGTWSPPRMPRVIVFSEQTDESTQ